MRATLPLCLGLLLAAGHPHPVQAAPVRRAPRAARAAAIPSFQALSDPLENSDLSVELHAHLFMKEGMGWMFTGDFFGPLEAKDWRDRFRSMANPESLERSGIGIVVAALYAHPLFELAPRESVRKQLALANRFVSEHPNWVIARTAAEAREALLKKKRVMVLALEGASGIIDSESDLEEFVDRGGIRIVNLLHLTDDEFGGVAFLAGINVLSSPWAWLKSLFHSSHDELGVKLNTNGLSDRGRTAALAMIKHGVWLDLAHASDAAFDDLFPIVSGHGRPLLYTHTVLRKYMKAERGISSSQLEKVKATRGFLGAMPAETMLVGTPVHSPAPCGAGFERLVEQYRELAEAVGAESIALGSDYNGGVQHLPPSCDTGTEIDREGLWNIGQAGELWKALAKAGAPVPKPLGKVMVRFLDAWARAQVN